MLSLFYPRTANHVSILHILLLLWLTRSIESTWIQADTTLPYSKGYQAVGYYEGIIYIIAGHPYQKDLIKYNQENNTFTDTNNNFLTISLFGSCQWWTQINNIVYLAGGFSNANISTLNLITEQFNPNVFEPPISGDRGRTCIAGDMNRPLLYYLHYGNLYILNITNETWSQGPNSNQPTKLFYACTASPNDQLWIIGGTYSPFTSSNTIQKVEYISTNNIYNQQWEYTPNDMTGNQTAYIRCVYYGGNQSILTIGGKGDTATNKIHAINTLTKEVRLLDETLAFPIDRSGVILINKTIYSFGGYNGDPVDKWQYKELSPTTAPTQSPSSIPTNDPTNDPTIDPTNNPTTDPTMDPTNDPTIDPTNNPTYDPTIVPTIAPTTDPSQPPSLAPSMSPTTCYDGNSFTNDGDEKSITDTIYGLLFDSIVTMSDKIIVANQTGQYIDDRSKLKFFNDSIQELRCNGWASCLDANIVFQDNSICNVYCDGYLSCKNAILSITNCREAQIICNGTNSCDEMLIEATADHDSDINIQCGVSTSCNDMIIDITGDNLRSNTTCYGLNACDRMTIEIDSDNYRNNCLNMYSYSMNVTFDNGFGYEEEDASERYVTCNTQNRFIKYNATNTTNTNANNNEVLTTLVNGEYLDGKFPCDGIRIQCFAENDENITSSCDMSYVADTSSFEISSPSAFATCYWVSVFDIIAIQCNGDCVTSPTEAPTKKPTQAPTQQTETPTNDPTSDPTNDPTMDPTRDPTSDPTTDPTIDPTRDPTIDPSIDPTIDPTSDPTNDPTIHPTPNPTTDPTNEPTTDPTRDPTHIPTIDPTNAPSISPSAEPSSPPTSAPSVAPTVPPSNSPINSPSNSPSQAPIISPSFSPSSAPSNAPTIPPTAAPSRIPTEDVDTIYDTYIPIEYACHNLSVANKNFIVDYTQKFKARIQEILESNYLDATNDVYYKDYWLNIYQINGVNIDIYNDITTNADGTTDLTIYDLDILNQQNIPTIFTATIECKLEISGILIQRSGTEDFKNKVELDLQQYLNNTDLSFNLYTTDDETLTALEKFPESTAPPEDEEDNTAIWISAAILFVAGLASAAAFVFNKLPSTKVDNAAFFTPLLVAIGIYDFISDINMSINVFQHPMADIDGTLNIVFLLGVLSIIFIMVPFALNLMYAMRINKQKAIRECPSARAWFAKHLAQFILLCVACCGTFPVLGLTSSRLFGLDFFNAGLLSSDLHELSKIKIRSTIFMENLPQLLIQIIYSIVISDLESATILAFIASSLSVIASVVIYQAQKEQGEEVVITKYYIRFADNDNSRISDSYHAKIKFAKGLKMKLGERLCKVFNIPNKSIEIGFVTPNVRGCIIHVQHSIFKDNLDELRDKVYAQKLDGMNQGLVFNITPELFAENIYKLHYEAVNEVFRDHFGIDKKEDYFIATYHKRYEDANVDSKANIQETKPFLGLERAGGNELKCATETSNGEANIIDAMAMKIKKARSKIHLSAPMSNEDDSKERMQIELSPLIAKNTENDMDIKWDGENDRENVKNAFGLFRKQMEQQEKQQNQQRQLMTMLEQMVLKNLENGNDINEENMEVAIMNELSNLSQGIESLRDNKMKSTAI